MSLNLEDRIRAAISLYTADERRGARNAAIEECARVAENRRWGVHTPLEEIAAAIRALKATPGDET